MNNNAIHDKHDCFFEQGLHWGGGGERFKSNCSPTTILMYGSDFGYLLVNHFLIPFNCKCSKQYLSLKLSLMATEELFLNILLQISKVSVWDLFCFCSTVRITGLVWTQFGLFIHKAQLNLAYLFLRHNQWTWQQNQESSNCSWKCLGPNIPPPGSDTN